MLTRDSAIVRYDFDSRRIVPDRLTRTLHGHYLVYAERMLGVYRSGAGRARHELHRAVPRDLRAGAGLPRAAHRGFLPDPRRSEPVRARSPTRRRSAAASLPHGRSPAALDAAQGGPVRPLRKSREAADRRPARPPLGGDRPRAIRRRSGVPPPGAVHRIRKPRGAPGPLQRVPGTSRVGFRRFGGRLGVGRVPRGPAHRTPLRD